ncbi:MAG: sulfotransferase [Rubricoccaceae bacterium]|nr:sulfotransferase [Rubricoccaceae bacterium]
MTAPTPPFSALPPGLSPSQRADLRFRGALKTHGLPLALRAYGRLAPAPHRRLHVYGVGLPKTGTHSIANLFDGHYRADHEARAVLTMLHLLRWLRGEVSDEAAMQMLRGRDRYLDLEVEAAHFLAFPAGLLARLYPEARFVLTIRDPYTWLNSSVTQSIRTYNSTHPNRAVWLALADHRYGRRGFEYAPEEAPLRGHGGVYPVRSYLDYWVWHIEHVLRSVPERRLFVLRTPEIKPRAGDLARWLGVPEETLSLEQAHAFARPVKPVDVFDVLPADFIEAEVQRQCGPLMERFFPEIRSLDDARARGKPPRASAS